MSKNPRRCQTAAIFPLSIPPKPISPHLCIPRHFGRKEITQCVSIMKNKPIFLHYAGRHMLTADITRNRITNHSRSCQETAVRNGFLTGKRDGFPIRSEMTRAGQVGRPVAHYSRQTRTSAVHEVPGTSVRTSNFSFSSPMPKPSGFRHSPSFIRRGLGGGIQYFPIHFRKPAQLTHSKMKNKPIFSHYQPPQPLTPIPPLQHSAKPLPFLNGFVETALRSSGSTTGFDLPEKYETALALASIYNPAVLHYMTLKGLPCTVRPLTYANG